QDPQSEIGSDEYNDPDKALGGTFPNFDNYNVVAQGITGSMRPHIYQQNLIKRHDINSDGKHLVIQYPWGNHDPKSNRVGFRFVNDFSNRLTTSTGVASDGDVGVFHSFGNIVSGEDGSSSYTDGVLNGASRRVEYYTNGQIRTALNEFQSTGVWPGNLLGYVETNSSGFYRDGLNVDQIGAYRITNESGVNYHFTLPAHSYDEYGYSENTKKSFTFNEYKNPEKYAYTWHLTGITGPDYVDRGGGPDGSKPNGKLDKNDWGYWVEFDYGKWTSQYFWRTPGEGVDEDLDSDFKSFSEGTKEVYYLDAIRTKTHTALFVKDVREDAKSSLKYFRNLVYNFGSDMYKSDSQNPISQENKDGGFEPKNLQASARVFTARTTLNYNATPTKSLRLSKIILTQNSDINFNKEIGSWPEFTSYPINWTNDFQGEEYELESFRFNQHLADNVLDVRDINESPISSKTLRVIKFDNNHYDLMPGTPNTSSGKLTLKSLEFLGKEAIRVIPSMSFSYLNEDEPYNKDKYDIWGMYKVDYTDTGDEKNDRLVTNVSSQKVDSWSLNQVKTSLGSDILIEYESDSYKKPALILNYSLQSSSIEELSSKRFRINFSQNSLDLSESFVINSKANGLFNNHVWYSIPGGPFAIDDLQLKESVTIKDIGIDYLEIDYK
ncbi:MAG: hypothetical protein AAFY41_08045, partial [Bacteroidota bacterium]